MTWHRIDDPENPPPKDGRRIIAIADPKDERWDYLAGRWFVIHHMGFTPSGLDMGWAAFPGLGVGNDFFSYWCSLDALPPPPVTQ